jgi:hypothetical protein
MTLKNSGLRLSSRPSSAFSAETQSRTLAKNSISFNTQLASTNDLKSSLSSAQGDRTCLSQLVYCLPLVETRKETNLLLPAHF